MKMKPLLLAGIMAADLFLCAACGIGAQNMPKTPEAGSGISGKGSAVEVDQTATRLQDEEPNAFSAEKVMRIDLKSSVDDIVAYDVSDSAEMKQILNYINAAPVLSKETVPASTGWSYWISCFGEDHKVATGAAFDTDSITIDNVRYHTEKDYFLPLIDRISENGSVIS